MELTIGFPEGHEPTTIADHLLVKNVQLVSEHRGKLTEWEKNFIDSIKTCSRRVELTSHQWNTFVDILGKVERTL